MALKTLKTFKIKLQSYCVKTLRPLSDILLYVEELSGWSIRPNPEDWINVTSFPSISYWSYLMIDLKYVIWTQTPVLYISPNISRNPNWSSVRINHTNEACNRRNRNSLWNTINSVERSIYTPSTINIQDNPNLTHKNIKHTLYQIFSICLHVFGDMTTNNLF